jgi:hypothetical protein
MADVRSRRGDLPDGTVGILSQGDKNVPSAPGNSSQVHVSVASRAPSDTRLIALQQDLRLLVQAFLQDSRPDDCETATATSPSGKDGDIHIAVHGLHLAEDEERELRQLMQEMVRKHFPGKEATK